MTARHPIQDAPPEKQREALEHIVGCLEAMRFRHDPLGNFAHNTLKHLTALADTRIPVRHEAYERIPHIHGCIGKGIYKLNEPMGHKLPGSEQECSSLGGRCAFKPEDE